MSKDVNSLPAVEKAEAKQAGKPLKEAVTGIKGDQNEYYLGMEQKAAEAKLEKDFAAFNKANFKYTAADVSLKALDPIFVTLVELFPSLKKMVDFFKASATKAGSKVMEPAFQTMHSFAEAVDNKELLASLDKVHKEHKFTKPEPLKKEEQSAYKKISSQERRFEKEAGASNPGVGNW